ncbi:putative Calmodulin-binding domain, plant [Helianthus annuus]|nr:putative Calmodulin-binding domain, plant [Helianthus annuus]
MATQTADNGNAKGTPESILEPAYMVAVGGGLSGSKAKTRTYTGRKGHITTSRYLRPKISSCHDRCKTGVRDEPPELKKPGRRLGVRKMWVKKKPARISVEPVERKKMTKPKPKPIPRPKIGAREEPTNRKSTQNELKLPIKHVKPKPSSSSVINGQKNKKEVTNNRNAGIVGKSTSAEQGAHKAAAHTRSSPRKHKPESPRKDKGSKTKAKIKQLLAEKITEITLNEAENEKLESVPPTVETVESPLKDERSMKETKLDQLIDEKITETTLHEAENAETIESPLKEEESTTKTKLKQLTAEKITEKTLQEAENAELESVPPTDETIESPPTVITESTNLSSSESSQSPSDKQVSEERKNSKSSSDKQVSEERETSKASLDIQVSEERENANNGEVNVSEDDDKTVKREHKENEGSKGMFMRGRTVVESEDVDPRRLIIGKGKIPEDEDDGPTWLKFRRGKTVEGEEDDGPTKLNFRRGKILEDEEIDESFAKVNFKKTIVEEPTDDGKKESETVTLKHQEMQKKKEAQELLNRMIEETASKLEIDRKTKVEALVGAFETVISLKDDAPEKS